MAKSVAADGEGASKFVIIKTEKCKNENDAKKILVNVGSIAGFFPNFTDPYYSSTKSFGI